MIKTVERLLKRIGWVHPFDKDDVVNAEIEDKQRDTENVIARLRTSLQNRLSTNEHLRESIKIAKRRTNSFEMFERHLLGRKLDD